MSETEAAEKVPSGLTLHVRTGEYVYIALTILRNGEQYMIKVIQTDIIRVTEGPVK
jgi:hypothetical protein